MLAERPTASDGEKARERLIEAYTAAAANGYWTVQRRATAALQRLDGPMNDERIYPLHGDPILEETKT